VNRAYMDTFKVILTFGALLAMGLVGVKVIPPYYSNYEFEDAIKNEALQSTYTSRSVDDIRATVIKHAHEYDITLTPAQVHVVRNGSVGTGILEIDAQYTVPLEFPGYSTSMDFHPSTSNKAIF
jgi:acyl-CoA synthetase (AMP-forming)/AMP-acid ligase II